jgi:hypothetical protein
MRIQPIVFTWRRVDAVDADGEVHRELAMVPIPRYRNVAARQYGDEGAEHTLMPYEERNMRFHNACFAELDDLYDNLPESVSYMTDAAGKFVLDADGHKIVRWPSAEHFRHDLLISTGWGHMKVFQYCTTRRRAMELATFIRIESENPYLKIRVSDHAVDMVDDETGKPFRCWPVTVQWAKSQSVPAMGKRDFTDSMTAILDRARSYVGVSAPISRKNAGRAA